MQKHSFQTIRHGSWGYIHTHCEGDKEVVTATYQTRTGSSLSDGFVSIRAAKLWINKLDRKR